MLAEAPLHPALYDIWPVQDDIEHPYRAQLIGYVACFRTQELAESYVAACQVHRRKQ